MCWQKIPSNYLKPSCMCTQSFFLSNNHRYNQLRFVIEINSPLVHAIHAKKKMPFVDMPASVYIWSARIRHAFGVHIQITPLCIDNQPPRSYSWQWIHKSVFLINADNIINLSVVGLYQITCLKFKIQNLMKAVKRSWLNYHDVIMTAMASQITGLTIVYPTVYWGVDQRKHQSSTSLAFVRGIGEFP